jgi:predicted nucleic acid-binding protein
VTYILHTVAIYALMRGSPACLHRLAQVRPSDVLIPQPAIAEIASALDRMPESPARAALQARFDLICSELSRVEWTDDVSIAYGRIKNDVDGRRIPVDDVDGMIAAHAVARRATLVTAKPQHLTRIRGLTVENWGR